MIFEKINECHHKSGKNSFSSTSKWIRKYYFPSYGGTFIDCTFGQGGYSKKILENKKNKVIALDRDPNVAYHSSSFIKKYKNRFSFHNLKFSEINKLKTKNLKGIIFDLGYSMNQIKNLKMGLSFKSKGKLNMKMGLNNFSSHDVISSMSKENLVKVFKFLGEEKFSKPIANRIIKERKNKIINTEDLINIIESIKPNKNKKINKSTQIFQSLRIYVNKEISELINGLINAYNILPTGGIIVVVSFHSIEDKITKFFFNNYSKNENSSRYFPETNKNNIYFNLLNKKPIIPSKEEISLNPPSRSSKLRYGIKIKHNCDFSELIKKFKYLIDIEDLKF